MEFSPQKRRLLAAGLYAAVCLLALRYLLPLVLPPLLGVLAAAALSPLIELLSRRFSLRRNVSAFLCVTGLLGLLMLLGYLLGHMLLLELQGLYGRLPELLSAASRSLTALGQWAERLGAALPGGAGDAFSSWAGQLTGAVGTIAASLYEGLFSAVSGFLGRLPDVLLFLLTMLLSCYFAAGELPRLRALIREHAPAGFRRRWGPLAASMRRVLGGWVRAQLLLMGVTFLILLAGLWILGIPFPLGPALGIALLDALPLFGTGTILLPWGLGRMIAGDFHMGLGLMILYGAAALCRNVLEPRLLGAQAGVSPLLTLGAIYLGYRVSGFLGMVLLPMALMVAAELWEASRTASVPVSSPSTQKIPHTGQKSWHAGS